MPKYKNRQCQFTIDQINHVDYKNIGLLKKYLSQYWKIVPSYYNGNSVMAQKMVSRAVKNARKMALLPYTKQ